jgi:hypothetical protein
MKITALAAALCLSITAVAALAAPPMPAVATTPAQPRPTMITVYEQPNFKGRALTFEKSVPSLAALDFNDRIGSVQIKGKRDWVLCEHRNFMGRCGRIRAKANNLKRIKLEGLVSSLYPVPEPVKKPR